MRGTSKLVVASLLPDLYYGRAELPFVTDEHVMANSCLAAILLNRLSANARLAMGIQDECRRDDGASPEVVQAGVDRRSSKGVGDGPAATPASSRQPFVVRLSPDGKDITTPEGLIQALIAHKHTVTAR